MIEVRVGEDHRVDFLRGNWSVPPVALAPLFWPLKKATINQHLKAVLAGRISSIDQVLGTGDRTRRAEELNVGQCRPRELINLPRRHRGET